MAQSIRIATIDRIVNELDAARQAAGLSKAELARAINSEPATVRRLFSAGQVNPTLGTLAEVAAALGMRVVLKPLEAGVVLAPPTLRTSSPRTAAQLAVAGMGVAIVPSSALTPPPGRDHQALRPAGDARRDRRRRGAAR